MLMKLHKLKLLLLVDLPLISLQELDVALCSAGHLLETGIATIRLGAIFSALSVALVQQIRSFDFTSNNLVARIS